LNLILEQYYALNLEDVLTGEEPWFCCDNVKSPMRFLVVCTWFDGDSFAGSNATVTDDRCVITILNESLVDKKGDEQDSVKIFDLDQELSVDEDTEELVSEYDEDLPLGQYKIVSFALPSGEIISSD